VSGRIPANRRAAIVGFAHSRIQRRADQTLGEITLATVRDAVADAGLELSRVDGFVSATMLPAGGGHAIEDGTSIVTPRWLAEQLGVTPRYVAGYEGGGQLVGSVALAVEALDAGAADYVVLHRALHNPPGRYHGNPMTEVGGLPQWTAPQGYFSPMPMIGLTYNEYAQRYGAPREALAAVVVEARKNGSRLPWSYWYGKPLTRAEYLDAPLVADPICRLDCDIPVDGVAAFVLTRADRAQDLPHPPVYVAGHATAIPRVHRLPLHRPLDDVMAGGFDLVRLLWERSGVVRSDIDLPQAYDGFSPLVLLWLEVLGLCPVGEAHRVVLEGGIDSDRAGAIPVLSGGGALGSGRMHGVPQMLECYLQLSRRAGERQRRANAGVACHGFPHSGGAVVYSVEPT
jgi:acetyl-CoA acetyltransferase